MNPRWMLCVICCTLAIAGRAPADETCAKVAVVDLAFIFEKYAMTKDLETAFDERRRRTATEAESRREAVEAKRKKLLPLKPASREFAELEQEITRMQIEYEVWATHQERALKDDHKRWLLRIYTNAREAVAELAVKSGIDLVLTYDQLADEAPDSIALRQQILLQKIVYFDDRIDLTQAVLTRLNENYAKDGGAAGLRLGAATPAGASPARAGTEVSSTAVIHPEGETAPHDPAGPR